MVVASRFSLCVVAVGSKAEDVVGQDTLRGMICDLCREILPLGALAMGGRWQLRRPSPGPRFGLPDRAGLAVLPTAARARDLELGRIGLLGLDAIDGTTPLVARAARADPAAGARAVARTGIGQIQR
jgi:hypothetical protein